MKHLYAALLFGTLLCIGTVASAAAGGKTIYDVTKARSVTAPVFHGIRLGSHLITLEKSTLAQVIALAGPNTIAHSGETATRTDEVCYRFSQNGRMRAVTFASGEMGGGTWITGISLSDDVPAGLCPALPAALSDVALDIGLRLGVTVKNAVARLGPPGGHLKDHLGWSFEQKLSLDGTDYVLSQFLDMTFSHGRATDIYISQVTVN